ncbi:MULTISPECIES: hypothetical protein [Bacillus cereus group]|uniref:hypothetical protein n=1 Tax=Bacillus cereus group TaxID=86661 RepID=UPI0030F3E19A
MTKFNSEQKINAVIRYQNGRVGINREQDWKTKYLSLTEEGKEFFNEAVSKQ